MKILEVCPYSAGGCGVFARVKQESILLEKRGHEMKIFSSYFEKGTDKHMPSQDKVGNNIQIQRFPATKLGGESFMLWKFEKEAVEYKPDVIICHAYRHLHTTKALKVGKKIGARVYLVTHAPFDRSDTRSFFSKKVVGFYDRFIGPKKLKQFDGVLAITKWEYPFLNELGLGNEEIIYHPNGVDELFYKTKISPEKENRILFLGRVSPIKQLETVIEALPLIKDKKLIFEIVGPPEPEYLSLLKNKINENKVEKRVIFTDPIYGLKEKIKKLDSAEMFILPSKSEGMPQSLVEALSRKMIVLASKNKASLDLMENGKNGFIYKKGDAKDLAETLDKISSMDKKDLDKIKENARKSVEKFEWNNLIDELERIISKPR